MERASRTHGPIHRHIPLRTVTAACGAALLQLSLPAPALGQTSQDQPEAGSPSETQQTVGLPPIIVHAQKQDEDLLTVPAAIAVVDGETLAEEGAQSLEALTGMVSGLSFQPMGQSGLMPPVIRGMNANVTSFSSSTALIVDGVPTLRGQGFEDPLLGVEQVEVLKGPQSTLYGRNAEAGVINITTRKPGNEPYAFISAEAGNHERRALRFDLSHPLVQDQLFLGVAGSFSRQDGFLENTWLDQKDGGQLRRSGRFALRWTPGARTDAILRYTQNEYRDQASLWGSPSSSERGEVRSGTEGWNRSTARTWSLDVTHRFDSGIRLRSTTARNTYVDDLQQDTDFQPADMMHIGRRHEFTTLSQELRLEGGEAGRTRWLAGLYLDDDRQDLSFSQKTPLALTLTSGIQKQRTSALFTHWTIPLSGPWALVAGGRLEQTRIRFDMPGVDRQSRTYTQFSPKLALQYAVNPRTSLYASLSEGYRAGGFNAFSPAAYREYDPEKVWALELGAKGAALDDTLRYGAALYAMDIRQMQVQQMVTPGQVFITNAATGRSIGAEFDIDYRLAPGWNLQAGLALNRSTFREFQDGTNNYDGNDNSFSPRVSGYAGLRYQDTRGWYAQARLHGASKVYLDAANEYTRNGFGVLDLSAGYMLKNVDLTVYVNNVADRHYDAVGFLNGLVTIYSPPREVGVRVSWKL
ncbi:TonB-dependent receptor [Castellaniella sp.]|uniref:TonB-dependent receptor n=1 Tax=Castellaniella sp. TaxID=1955812 RepID=UPI002B002C7F|nr:TonB-dependent receptor [Castellaniella sp.]